MGIIKDIYENAFCINNDRESEAEYLRGFISKEVNVKSKSCEYGICSECANEVCCNFKD